MTVKLVQSLNLGIPLFLTINLVNNINVFSLSEDVYQTAKVAKVLFLLNDGKGSELKGKKLSEIQITSEEQVRDNNGDETALSINVDEPPTGA